MKYIYPAVISKGEFFTVTFPDLKGCYTQGKDLAEALEMGEDALNMWLFDRESRGLEVIPFTENYKSENPDDIVTLISADTERYRRQISNVSVKKTLTIPMWLNEQALEKNVNFSAVLQKGLQKELGIA
jgi:predicted RNase H-like HicB family nuclease